MTIDPEIYKLIKKAYGPVKFDYQDDEYFEYTDMVTKILEERDIEFFHNRIWYHKDRTFACDVYLLHIQQQINDHTTDKRDYCRAIMRSNKHYRVGNFRPYTFRRYSVPDEWDQDFFTTGVKATNYILNEYGESSILEFSDYHAGSFYPRSICGIQNALYSRLASYYDSIHPQR